MELKSPPSIEDIDGKKTFIKRKKEEEKLIRKMKSELVDFAAIQKANRERFLRLGEAGLKTDYRSVFTTPEKKTFLTDTESERTTLTVGEFVGVKSDTSPGMNREGGCGFITEILLDDISGTLLATVKYELDGNNRSKIPLSDITVKDYQSYFSGMVREKRKGRSKKREQVKEALDFSREGKSSIEILRSSMKEGVSKRRPKGWHRRELKLNMKFEVGKSKVPRYNDSEMTQLIYEYDLLSAWLEGSGANKYYSTGRNGKLKKRRTKNNPDTLTYLMFSWGASFDTITRIRKKLLTSSHKRGVTGPAAMCTVTMGPRKDIVETNNIIDSFESARKLFTAEYLFVRDKVMKVKDQVDAYKNDLAEVNKTAKAEFKTISTGEREKWEAVARAHLERHRRIPDIIRGLVRKNPSITYHGIANALGHWCSASTIQRWVTSREGYKLYTERVIPLLTKEQREKHLAFAKHLINNWGKGIGKYLLIHFDEKWFWGMLMRMTAKTFDGVAQNIMRIYHKCHVSKTMGIAAVAMAFEDSLENGGTAVKMLFHRSQSAKVAQRLTKNKKGEKLREKGDIYYVDCNITGSSEGTAKDPKFPLLEYFKHAVFPEVQKLTGPGGRFFGYTPVFQGDNAGPHKDAKFAKFVRQFCDTKGWLWEPQGPQMPHVNVLDLAVFPAMSRRHSHLSRSLHGTRVLKEDEIWNAAVEVWKDLPSSKVANAFVLMKRVADKIIHTKGSNDFLSGVQGSIHCGVRPDFIDTEDGNVRRDGVRIPFVSTTPTSLPINPLELPKKEDTLETTDPKSFISL